MIGESDKYLEYIYNLWKSNVITKSEYENQVDVMTDYRIWLAGEKDKILLKR